jgi:reverse gyrase
MVKNKQNYMNNPNLPTVGAEFEYTPEMVKDLKKCQKNILHFAEKFFYIISLDEGKQPINLHYCQKRALRKMRDNRFFILLASRQIGKTTMMTIYALWVACFNNDQRILIVANKEGTALEIMSRIRMAYEELPNWLMTFGNQFTQLFHHQKNLKFLSLQLQTVQIIYSIKYIPALNKVKMVGLVIKFYGMKCPIAMKNGNSKLLVV